MWKNVKEIKFRVKIKGDAGIYEVWSIDWLWEKMLVRRNCGDEWVKFVKIQQLMQWTGLYDKNGKLIYAHDIVRVPAKYFRVLGLDREREEDRIGMVWADNELSQYNIGDLRWNVILRGDLSRRYYEVIGNKYENPELLPAYQTNV